MFEDMEKKGIVFDLQWKTRNLVSSGEEFASIGIWEVDDTSLDWSNFKPYLCQTLGNVENLSVSYVDSDGDLIPIESNCEFQEALKYARKKAAMGQKLILKVEKLDSHSACGGVELSSSPIYIKSSNFIKERLKFHTGNNEDQNPFHLSTGDAPIKIGSLSSKVKCKARASEVTSQIESSDATPPLWFKKYMQKMKKEIVEEVTSSLTQYFTEMLDGKQKVLYVPPADPIPEASDICAMDARAAKNIKKVAEENSTEAVKMEIRDRELFKKIEKLHRREKRLDHKKEKLEQKSKKIAERKEREYLSKLRLERAGCRRPHCDGFIRKYKEAEKLKQKKLVVNDSQPTPPVEPQKPILAFKLLSSDKRTHSVKRGCKFLKKWKVVNTGNVSWTDETEVKLSWGNAGLEPDGQTWKCPLLQPGEEGDIFIKFYAPDFPGLFESHWNLFHKNTRFGGGIRLIIAVDLITSSEDETKSGKETSLSSNEFCVTPKAKTVRVKDDKEVISKGQNESLIVTDEAAASPQSEKIFPKIKSFASASVPWESLDDGDEEDEEEKEAENKIETRKEGEFESVFTDDFNGSFTSIGSDSDDNFVVVPMPPCFRFDVPLNSVPVSTKEESAALNDDSPNTPVATAPPNCQSSKSPQKSIESLAVASTSRESSIQESEVSCDTGEVIAKQVPPPEVPLIADLKQLNVSEQPEVTSPQKRSPEPVLPPPLQPTPAPAPKSRAAPAKAQSSSPPPSDHVLNSPNGSPQNAGGPSPAINIPTNQARFSPRPRPIDLMPPVLSEVWNEAMNATTSALNTAFSALDTIIGPSVTPGQVHSVPPNEAEQEQPMDPKMIEDLSHLTSMGFCNLELNEALLRVHNHNITEVTPGQVHSVPPNEAEQEQPMDPKMIEDLSHLTSMGFCNLELNEALLRVHNHNITEVVESLLERED
ncbi:hypothetical protein J437_LFUL009785 [Ladona fulva]|uniref:UBA domain-containing protein n=1 Tax=Ladona fulva TaxID=123851 RepID=A0A8K0K9I4_LADFU|nr:hypothetical protein J437_LFUL009785 [Ladona fulva]